MEKSLKCVVVLLILLVARGSSAESCDSKAESCGNAEDTWELTYFDGRGLAEITRTLFAARHMYAGRGFTDTRLSREQMTQMREDGLLEFNLNRVPILKHNT